MGLEQHFLPAPVDICGAFFILMMMNDKLWMINDEWWMMNDEWDDDDDDYDDYDGNVIAHAANAADNVAANPTNSPDAFFHGPLLTTFYIIVA